ncbi:MAG: hypothetical protein Fur0023_16500 [Bacteroidia bacterium]
MRHVVVFVIAIALWGCKREYRNPDYSTIKVRIENYWHDTLISNNRLNVFNYISCANDTCSLSKTECVFSRFLFYKNGGVFYADTSCAVFCNSSVLEFEIDSVPCNNYDSLSFQIGDNNPANKNDVAINNMSWPLPMGGGYHFIKYEGKFLKNNIPIGYALHAGGNHLSPLKISYKMPFIIQYAKHSIYIKQNIDKWISGNYCLNLSVNNYTMGNDSIMNILLKNGKNAVFVSFK